MMAIRSVTVGFDSGVRLVVAESKFRWSKTKVLGNSLSEPFSMKFARLKVKYPSSTESTVPQGSDMLAILGPVGALQDRHHRKAAMRSKRGSSHHQMGTPFFTGSATATRRTAGTGAAPQMSVLWLRPKAVPSPSGIPRWTLSRWLVSNVDKPEAVIPEVVKCRPSTPKNKLATRLSSVEAEANRIPDALATRLATLPARSPNTLDINVEPVFSTPSVTAPPDNNPPRLLCRSSGNLVPEIRLNNFDAPPGVDASLHAIPAILGTAIPKACAVLAGVSPITDETLETTSEVSRELATSRRFTAITVLPDKTKDCRDFGEQNPSSHADLAARSFPPVRYSQGQRMATGIS